jgi:hypothetical protein
MFEMYSVRSYTQGVFFTIKIMNSFMPRSKASEGSLTDLVLVCRK